MHRTPTLLLTALFLVSILLSGCSKDSDTPGGDPSPIGTVGNQFTGSLTGVSNFNAIVSASDGGISTINVTGTITDPVIREIIPFLNSNTIGEVDPATGNFSYTLKVKFTDKGVVDYFGTDGKPSTLVSYDAKAGDSYKCKNAEGGSFTRSVTARSDVDDYPYGFMLIKTITIEEPVSNPAVTKVTYRANHRFGIVNITAILQDGTTLSFPVYSTNEN